ncbi:efflux RND transporter permease subunit [Paenibacillus sp. MER TA 81-3]|uniref:efflux RND transporter permease subunit n=1 Tax=Paenibacillus sp. MER TA 81-3 TaxID=2939573 RepID=UPI00203A5628|nr:efflux RND transporter permease subunit [Paenibacillus sp. MER TA 81-3]MCM3338619.1 efflux RND transporter permease subunit [Paenibacillus sp. MER TA 81-3]
MNSLIRFSMKNVAAVLIIVALLFGGGVYASTGLKIDNMPDISFPLVLVTASYPAPPQDVMEEVTKPLEKKISGMERIKSISSTSSDQISSILVTFEEGVDPERKKSDIESLIQEVSLPSGMERPHVSTLGVASIPSYYLAAYADEGMTQSELEQHFEKTIKPGFQALRGLDHMDIIGASSTTLNIRLSPERLRTYGLAPAQVSEALRSALAFGPAGTVEIDGNTLLARMDNGLRSVKQLEGISLQTALGGTVHLAELGQIAEITESKFMARLDDQPAIGILLYKASGSNAVEFSNGADRLMEQWKSSLSGVTFKKVYNYADQVKESIGGLVREGLIGALLASVMILVFLKNIRMTLIVLVSIPLSVLIALLLMKWMDISLNIMTLGGMFIAIGRVVDDSIVVIENIYSKLQRAKERDESVIALATKEVANAITSSTLTTVGVFAPIGMISGPAGQLFRPFAITLACALMASLLVALTVIPMLAKLIVLKQADVKGHGEPKTSALTSGYRRMLEWSLTHRLKTLLISALLLIVTMVAVVPQLSFTFMPEGNPPRQFFFTVKLPYESSLKTTDFILKEMESELRAARDGQNRPLFTFIETLVGYGGDPNPLPYMAQVYTEVNEEADVGQVKREYKAKLAALLPAGSELDTRTLSGEAGSAPDFTYVLYGEDAAQLERAAAVIKQEMKQFPELSEIKDSLSEAASEVVIDVDPRKANQFGLTPAVVQNTLQTWLFQDKIGEYRYEEGLLPTVVETEGGGRNGLQSVGLIQLKTPTQDTIAIADIADIKQVQAPASIKRDNQKQVINITAKITGQNKGGISAQVAAGLDPVELPEGISRSVSGVSEDIGESFSQLFVAMAAAVFVVYLIMVLAFGNASAPFAILFSLPFAAIGGVLGLFVTNESINITSLIGFMMLIGIVVTNAIVYIDKAQQLREAGFDVRPALVEAGLSRLRPIIMTAGATIMALLPLAFGFGHGTLISRGLAVVVIGGLTVSTLLTLIVVPIIYDIIARLQRGGKRTSGQQGNDVAPHAAGKGI